MMRPAERNGAHGEPPPAQGEPGDDVRQPVEVEQDAAAGDGDGDPDRRAREDVPHMRRPPPPREQRQRGVERRGRRRVPAGEGRPERRRRRVDRRPGPVDDPLDGVGDERVAHRDNDQEDGDPPAGHADHLDDPGDQPDHDHTLGRGEQADPGQDVVAERGRVLVRPARGRRVEIRERLAPADEQGEQGRRSPRRR